jgi:hypothetical protein
VFLVQRCGIVHGHVESLIQFFDIPKADDIRLVYNGLSCGWAPNFWLPSTRIALRTLVYNYYSVDSMDVGEMFLNILLRQSLQTNSGVHVMQEDLNIQKKGVCWFHWSQTCMGSRPSPYISFYNLAEDFICGNPCDRANKLVLNLPCSATFDPTHPKVIKWDSTKNWIASDLVVFIDDLRGLGPTVGLTWALTRTVASRIQYLSIQEESRKRRRPT